MNKKKRIDVRRRKITYSVAEEGNAYNVGRKMRKKENNREVRI